MWDQVTFGCRLDALRTGRAMTKAELARQIGRTRGYICHLVAGRRMPSAKTLCDLAATLQVTIEALTELPCGPKTPRT
jgi:transcriptional regulator with XRE-family HTH domain